MPLSGDFANSLVNGFSDWKSQQPTPEPAPAPENTDWSAGQFFSNLKDDLVNSVENYINYNQQQIDQNTNTDPSVISNLPGADPFYAHDQAGQPYQNPAIPDYSQQSIDKIVSGFKTYINDAKVALNNVDQTYANTPGQLNLPGADPYYAHDQQGQSYMDPAIRTPEEFQVTNNAAREIAGKPLGNLAVTPFVPAPIRGVAGALYTPFLAQDMINNYNQNSTVQNADGTQSEVSPWQALGNTTMDTLVNPILTPVVNAVSHPIDFVQNIMQDPNRIYSDVFLPAAVLGHPVKAIADKALSLPTVQDMIDHVEDKLHGNDITETTNNMPNANGPLSDGNILGRVNDQNYDLQDYNNKPALENDISANNDTTDTPLNLTPDMPKIDYSLLSQARDAAERDDYQTASQLAYRAGDDVWAEVYRRMNEKSKQEIGDKLNTDSLKPPDLQDFSTEALTKDLSDRVLAQLEQPKADEIPYTDNPSDINDKTWYHGTGTKNLTADMLDPNSTKIEGLFGHGIYLTDNPKIAEGYANARGKRTGTPTTYETKVNVGNVLDLENPMPENAYNIFREMASNISKRWDDPELLNRIEQAKGKSGENIYREFSKGIEEISQDQQIPSSEFVEDFQDLSTKLKEAGYDAYTHIGGKRTGNAPHQVLIMLDPNETMSQSGRNGQITSFKPTTSKLQDFTQENLKSDLINRVEQQLNPQKEYSRSTPPNQGGFSMPDSLISDNIKRGNAAMDHVIENQTDYVDAMHRPDLGSVSFYWGTPGTGAKFKKGSGISHIIAKRTAEGADGEAVARNMVNVIAKGKVTQIQEAPLGSRALIEHDGHTAVLSLYKEGNRHTWLVTGWENTKEASSANGKVYDSPNATTSGATRFQPEGAETSITNNIQQSSNLFNGESNQQPSIINKLGDIANKSAFVRDDLAPATKTALQTINEGLQDIRNVLSPASAGENAKLTAGIMRENLADMAQKANRADAALGTARDYFSKQTPEKCLEFMHSIETGAKQSTPELQEFANTMRHVLDGRRQEIQDLGTGKLQKYIENYFPHMWEDPKRAENFAAAWFGKRPFEGKKSFLKSRSLPTIADGIEAGLKPVSYNPVDLSIIKMREMDKYIMAHKTLNELKDKGLVKFVRATSTDRPEGWTKLDDRVGTVYGPSEVNVKEAYDPSIVNALNRTLDKMGIDHSRLTKIPLGKEAAGVWGVADKYSNEIITKFGGPESVIAHELGHQLAYNYHLEEMLRSDRMPMKLGNKYTTAGAEMSRELEILADKRMNPNSMSDAERSYVQGGTEPIAAVVEAYVHAPDLLKEYAPTVYKNFVKFLDAHPELHELRDIKPSLQIEENNAKQSVGGLVVQGHYYLPNDVARLINNYLSPGLREKSGIVRAYMGVANVMNQFQLGMSAFHLGFTSMDSIVSKVALGAYKMSHGDVVSAMKDFTHSPISPVENALRGDKLYKEWMKPGSTNSQTASLVDALKAGGGRVKMDDMYQTKIMQTMKDAYRQGNYLGAAGRLPFAIMEQSVKPILEYIVPRQKLGVFSDLMRYEMERNPNMSREELRATSGKIWDSVDNRLGQLCYDNLFWHKYLKEGLMATTRSVGWNLGTWRELGGAAVDTAQQIGKLAKGEKTKMSYRMSYGLALPVTVGLFGSIIQYMYTGQGPQDMKDLFFPRTGTLDAHGRPQRIELPSYMKDLYAYYEHPGTTITNKLHPMISVIADMLKNKDYYGKQIYNQDDNLLQKASDLAKFAGKQFIPFALQGSKYQADLGGNVLSKALPFFGITPSPSDVNKTDVEKKISELLAARMPLGSKTQAQAEKSDLKNSILRDMQMNNGTPTKSLHDALSAKQITPAEAKELATAAKLTPLQRGAQKLGADDVKNLINIANPNEKQVLENIYKKKIYNQRNK